MKIIISQSMYFPWVGFLEQLSTADVFVRYDDVQFSKGSFSNRVQVKTPDGTHWMTIPLGAFHHGQKIDEIQTSANTDWRRKHLAQLTSAYRRAPYRDEMLALAEGVLDQDTKGLADIAYESIRALSRFLNLDEGIRWLDSRDLAISGSGTDRVLGIVQSLGGTSYITGHGAKNYLDHKAFEDAGIEVRYMKYRCQPYPQIHGTFTPYVSALDLVASCGRNGREFIKAETTHWREFIA
jgi:hypothetical protein